MPIYHYVVVRQSRQKTTVYDYGRNIKQAMSDLMRLELDGVDCLLLGADSIETLKLTHSNWVPNTVKVVKK